ncbi:hypothetical protein VNI00_000674 [Paramarasmius palmivorus]|uniref:Uncharacterized protein n=1 Tax=Paramarasmius palmivorus TaxID=297713 RepID=A0AAW0EBA1_9AGAR
MSQPANTTELTSSQQLIWDFLGKPYEETYGIAMGRPLTTEDKASIAQTLINLYGSAEYVVSKMRESNWHEVSKPRDNRFRYFGARCPQPGVRCESRTFDNIQIYYRLDDQPLLPQGSYSLYVARPGHPPSECIDWLEEDIAVFALGFDGHWGGCKVLTFPPSTRIRFEYSYLGSRRTQEVILPSRTLDTTAGAINLS